MPFAITRKLRDIMDRRELLGVLGAGAAGLVALDGGQARADQEGPHDDPIKTLGECAKICDEAARHCLDEYRHGGKHAEDHTRANKAAMDCRDFCVLAAKLMARKSPMARYAHMGAVAACRACAEASEHCYDEVMKECARQTRICERMCRRLAVADR
jgi:hypothetical protein